MHIKNAQKTGIERQTSGKMRLDDGGILKEIEMPIVYLTTSIKESKSLHTEAKKALKEKGISLAVVLLEQYKLRGLPDFEDDNGDPIAFSVDENGHAKDQDIELLESMDVYNLNVIAKAILEDSDPK